MQVAGSTVLLTGATGGIGQALARGLTARGAQLVLTGRRADALAPLADELGVRVVVADLANAADVARLEEEAGTVDILVANAALPSSGQLLDYSVDEINSAIAVNLRAPIVLTRLLAPAMVKAGRGHIVHIGSLAGRTASPSASLYNATKFGLRGFTLGLRQDLRASGVGISIVQPGFVRDAGMFADSGAHTPPGVGTVTPDQVVAGVVKAIEQDKAEINVAPFGLRLATTLGSIFPGLSARVQQRVGVRTARELAEGQAHKR